MYLPPYGEAFFSCLKQSLPPVGGFLLFVHLSISPSMQFTVKGLTFRLFHPVETTDPGRYLWDVVGLATEDKKNGVRADAITIGGQSRFAVKGEPTVSELNSKVNKVVEASTPKVDIPKEDDNKTEDTPPLKVVSTDETAVVDTTVADDAEPQAA